MSIERINELAKKSKEIGLTDIEKIEQQELRAKYLVEFRKNFQKQLNNVYIVDENGNEIQLTKKNDKQFKN